MSDEATKVSTNDAMPCWALASVELVARNETDQSTFIVQRWIDIAVYAFSGDVKYLFLDVLRNILQ